MGKRARVDEFTHDVRSSNKKPKHDFTATNGIVAEIHNSRQLQNLLVFQQDQGLLLTSINSFKSFLASILHADDEDDVPRRRAILQEYLDSQRPRDVDEEPVYLPDLMQSWNYAATSNSDSLLSAVASTIDQLLKVLSSRLELREIGLLLCRTLLQQAQLRILSRGISAPKQKEHVIGPCLRILKEVVSFDGGTLARQVYAKRDLAFDPQTIARCLTYRRVDSDEVEDIVKRPTVRTTAIRYVLTNFKFQDDGAKADMLRQTGMLRNLVDGIEQDHPRIISEILHTLLRYVIQDTAIPRRNKNFLFNERNLLSLAQLYRTSFPEFDVSSEGRQPLIEQIHTFMVTACTLPDAGLLRASGWYPPAPEDDPAASFSTAAESSIDLGLSGVSYYRAFNKNIPLRNNTLADFILNLRPYAYDYERRLLLAIFEAAPELVAWFMRKMSNNYPFTPKLTSTWIGYAATVFETVRLPVPQLFARMAHIPPPVSIVIESVLPGPLDFKTLRSCLASKSELVRFFAVRILVASFIKLKEVLELFGDKTKTNGRLWEEAAQKLIEEFCRRCPTLQDVVKLYNTIKNESGDKVMQREATLRLLACYHEVLPQIALEENFDVSAPLAKALEDTDSASQELGHLVRIASLSNSVHWYSKPKTMRFSPISSILRLIVNQRGTSEGWDRNLLQGILSGSDAIQTVVGSHGFSTLDVLVSTLRALQPSDVVYSFLDRCLHRFTTRPIKFEDDKDALFAKMGKSFSQPVSLLLLAFVEQYDLPLEHKEEIGRWLKLLLTNLQGVEPLAEVILQDLRQEDKDLGRIEVPGDVELQKRIGTIANEITSAMNQSTVHVRADHSTLHGDKDHNELVLDMSTFAPAAEAQDHPVLTRYRKKDLATLIEDGSLSALISCLSSQHFSIRTQALNALRATMHNLEQSNHLEKDTIYLLLGELLETCADPLNDVNEKPLLGLVVTFAAKSVEVLKDPTHALYVKVNEYLNKGPKWYIKSLPAYWLEHVLLHPPGDMDSDGAYWREVVWVLEWLGSGLLTNDDFDNLRRNGVFEKIMALFFHPALEKRKFAEFVADSAALEKETGLQNKVRPLIMRMVCKAACMEGATVLLTGMGVLAWLEDVKGLLAGDRRALEVGEIVKNMILTNADRDRIVQWSNGALDTSV